MTLIDKARDANETRVSRFPELKHVPNLTNNHLALWEAIRAVIDQGKQCTKFLIRTNMKLKGANADKKFGRWLQKLINDRIIAVEGKVIRPLIEW